MSSEGGRSWDFFISYTPADEKWATWIAWQLEMAGYRTLIQAWDFIPGSNFIDFMDRGVRDSAVVLPVLSRNYLSSRNGTKEWQAAYRTDPGKLMPVRVGECELEGLLATLTYIDLVPIRAADEARRTLLARLGHMIDGRARPQAEPAFPHDVPAPERFPAAVPADPVISPRARRTPSTAPSYPGRADRDETRIGISILHIAGPRFGRALRAADEPETAAELQADIHADVTDLIDRVVPRPDLIVVSGDLTDSARPAEIVEALDFLRGLRVLLGLESNRLLVVPGNHDASKLLCEAYFLQCRAADRTPQPPYFPKLTQFARLFAELYEGMEDPIFDIGQPWTLFEIPELQVVVAGLNSAMAVTHLPGSDYGWIGRTQAVWFAERLRRYESDGWLRLGVVRHDPLPGSGARPDDPAVLHDADSLGRLLGGRLNLLVHGPGPGGHHVDLLGTRLPVLPATTPGSAEIIHITADGLTRYSCGGTWKDEYLSHPWTNAAAVFPTDTKPEPSDQDPIPDSEQLPDPAIRGPHDRLLDQVEEACRTRFADARILRVPTVPPHLLITSNSDGVLTQRRIWVYVGEPTWEVVEEFLGHDPGYGSELVYQLVSADSSAPPRALRDRAIGFGVTIRSFAEFQGLLELGGYLSQQAHRLATDPRYLPELYVPQRFRTLEQGDQAVHDDLVAELLRVVSDDRGRFVLVLGDFGRGKTFALRELARRISTTMPALIPILIELRALDRAHSVDELVAAHLARRGEERIDLRALHYMLREGRVVLLFDGFDELVTRISYEYAARHLETLLQAAVGKAKIIVASRTQHFESRDQVLTALGERVGMLHDRLILSVEDFTPAQIRAFLANRYGGDTRRADKRMGLITGIEDLLGLAHNPRMLTFIADLDEHRLRAAAGAGHAAGPAKLYREVLESWLTYEVERTTDNAGALPGLSLEVLWRAVTALALRLWESNERYLTRAVLTDVATVLAELTGPARMSVQDMAHTLGSGSLLVRTEDNLFGFIHRSVTEWLVANHIAEQLTAGVESPEQLAQAALSPLSIDFLCDLADIRRLRAWTDAVLSDSDADAHSRTNAIRVTTRLRTSPGADLTGAQLAGEDLSYRDLRGVDLTGADLTGAQLRGAILDRAILRRARLVRARLDEASLVGADLRDADLTGARLVRADLSGSRASGSRWSRAALLDVTGIPTGTDLLGAAVVPGMAAAIQFAPAAIGVRHGFNASHGRLPQPVAYSPGGSIVLIGSDDGAVQICDPDIGQPVRTLQGHRARSYAVACTSDVLITGSGDGTVGIWDGRTGESLRILTEHKSWPWPVVSNQAGDLLATGDAEGVLRLWRLPTGALRHKCTVGDNRDLIFSIAIHGTLVAAAHRGGTVRLWDTETGRVTGEFVGNPRGLFRIAFDPSGRTLAVGGMGGTLALWDPVSCRKIRDLPGHSGRIYTVDFRPDGRLLASGDTDGGFRLWNVDTGALLHSDTDHVGAAVYWIAFDPTGNQLASGDSAGRLFVRDGATAQIRYRLTGHTGSVWPFAFRPSSDQIAVSDDQFTTRMWDPVTGGCEHVLTGHGRQVWSVSFNADSTRLADCGNDGVIRLWDPTVVVRRTGQLTGSDDRLVTFVKAVFSPTRPELLAVVTNEGRVSLYNLDTETYERHIQVEFAQIWALAFDPTGELLATANDDDTVTIWVRTTGSVHAHCGEHHGRVRSIAFNADGTLMATGCDDSIVRLWDVRTGQFVRELHGHRNRVYGVAFHGNRLASVSWDKTVRIWDTDTGTSLHELTRHSGNLWAVAVDPHTGIVATGGDDLVIRLWDMETGRYLRTLEGGHTRQIWSLTFDPTGRWLASAGDDGLTLLWSMTENPPDDVAAPSHTPSVTLLGLPAGWAALARDGRYKSEGNTAGQFWWAVGMCRFEPGELDPFVSTIRRIPPDAPFEPQAGHTETPPSDSE